MRIDRMIRCFAALLVVGMLFGLTQIGVGADKKVKITFMHHWTGTDPKALSFEPALKTFQANNPNIELEVIANPGSKAETRVKLQTAFAAGTAPDVFLYDAGAGIEPYVKAGKIADLTQLVTEDRELKKKFMPGTMDLGYFDGKLYALPLELWTEHIFVNTRLLKKFNLQMPKTYDEFKVVVKALKSNGIIPIAFANKGGAQGRYFYSVILTGLSDSNLLKNACASKNGAKFTDKPFVRAAEVLMELAKLGAYAPGVNGIIRDNAVAYVNDEKAAMYCDGPTAGALIKKELQPYFQLLNFPLFPETPNPKALVAFPANFIEVNAETKKDPAKYAAAIKLIKYLASKEVVRQMAEVSAHLSPVVGVRFDKKKLPPIQLAIIAAVDKTDDPRWHINTSINPAVYTKFGDAIANMLDGIGTPESNMKLVQDKQDEVMAPAK